MEKWHVGQGNGAGCVFADAGRMRLEDGDTMLYPICQVIDFAGDMAANTRLIAAAPDLLEALKQLVGNERRYEIPYDDYMQAVAAIAHAAGGD